jgi:hypothetical protein
VKTRYYKDLSEKYGRTAKAFEYRMQNISFLFSTLNRVWVKGLPPAKNVGINVRKKLHELLIEIETGDSQKQAASTQSTISKKEVNSMEKFPKGLLSWSGSKQGGVRKPFQRESGRPTGKQISTPLVSRLDKWIDGIVSPSEHSKHPRSILLVGGPGNGKTDAVEGCIEKLDKALGAQNKIFELFTAEYNAGKGELAPRKVHVDLSTFWPSPPEDFSPSISLVQDATEKDQLQQEKSAEEIFLNELEDILLEKNKGLYICCVNRGILASTLSLAHSQGNADLIELIDNLLMATTGSHDPKECWPLHNYKKIALWPMDIESLVNPSLVGNDKTVAYQILSVALNPDKWVDTCDAGSRCPFCENRRMLETNEARYNLVKVLHYYELASGKRWTFRDIYSLVSYLLVGEQEDLTIKGKPLDPCDWATHQLKMANESDNKKNADLSLVKARYLLVSKLYYHKLFSVWPRLNSGSHRKAKSKVLPASPPSSFSTALKKGYEFARNHYRHLASSSLKNPSSIEKILTGEFSNALDPGLINGGAALFKKGEKGITANDIDERFGLSLKDGLKLIQGHVTQLEKDLLEKLSSAEEMLFEYNHKLALKNHVRLLQSSIRQFASRLIKRNIGVTKGVCYDSEYFERFKKLDESHQNIKSIENYIKALLHENSRFKASLTTTFGQPIAHRDRNISLETEKVSVKFLKTEESDKKPRNPTSYVKIHNNPIPVTFKLFKSLEEIGEGLQVPSLPEEIFALLDEVRAIVAGQIVRDEEFLENELIIEIGNNKFALEINNGKPVMGEKIQ